MTNEGKPGAAVNLLTRTGTGPLWGMASADLNATLLAWPPGHEVAEHTTSELDVLLIVLEGGGTAKVDGDEHALVPGSALLVERGRARAIRAGVDGLDTSPSTDDADHCRLAARRPGPVRSDEGRDGGHVGKDPSVADAKLA